MGLGADVEAGVDAGFIRDVNLGEGAADIFGNRLSPLLIEIKNRDFCALPGAGAAGAGAALAGAGAAGAGAAAGGAPMSPQPASVIVFHFQLPPTFTSVEALRPDTFTLPMVIVKSSTTAASASDITLTVNLCFVFMSAGMLSQKGFISARYSSREAAREDTAPLVLSVIIVTGKSMRASMPSQFFAAASFSSSASHAVISFFTAPSFFGLRAPGPTFDQSIAIAAAGAGAGVPAAGGGGAFAGAGGGAPFAGGGGGAPLAAGGGAPWAKASDEARAADRIKRFMGGLLGCERNAAAHRA